MIPTNNAVEVLIIGAGTAGLAVGGGLRRAGIPFEIFDSASDVGASWRQHYDRLHLHTIKRFSALPYRLFPADTPRYPSRQQFVDYLSDYAHHFQIEPRFNQRVELIRRVDTTWEVRTTDSVYHAQQVVVATGTNRVPNVPVWPGQDQFAGKVIHSAEYKNGAPFHGQNVLVVGFGNSGTEIAIDLWEHQARPSLSVRSPVNVIARDVFGLIPTQALSVLIKPLPLALIDRLNAIPTRLRFGNLTTYHLKKLPYGAATQTTIYGQIPMIDIGGMALICAGNIAVRPGIERFTANGVLFTDGTRGAFDTVILATGYRTGLTSLLPAEYALLEDNGYPVANSTSAMPGLYFCGFHVSIAGMLYEISRDARRIARQIAESRQGV